MIYVRSLEGWKKRQHQAGGREDESEGESPLPTTESEESKKLGLGVLGVEELLSGWSGVGQEVMVEYESLSWLGDKQEKEV